MYLMMLLRDMVYNPRKCIMRAVVRKGIRSGAFEKTVGSGFRAECLGFEGPSGFQRAATGPARWTVFRSKGVI